MNYLVEGNTVSENQLGTPAYKTERGHAGTAFDTLACLYFSILHFFEGIGRPLIKQDCVFSLSAR